MGLCGGGPRWGLGRRGPSAVTYWPLSLSSLRVSSPSQSLRPTWECHWAREEKLGEMSRPAVCAAGCSLRPLISGESSLSFVF